MKSRFALISNDGISVLKTKWSIGTQGMQEIFFVKQNPLEVVVLSGLLKSCDWVMYKKSVLLRCTAK